jgi:hypothetical protein
MANTTYRNLNPKYDDTRYKVNNALLRMMNTNPALGVGYLIGNALGENYWGRKRAKTAADADKNWNKGSIGADEKNGVTGVPSSAGNRGNDYYTSMNKAFDEYRNGNNGRVLYEGRSNAPRTPQQNNTSGVTVGNAGNGGGVTSVADAYNRMANGSGYNAGNTGLYTNGVRNMGNVIGADANGVYGVPTGIGADVNGVYGIPTGGSAPSAANIPRSPQTKAPNPNPAPIPYTAEQLAQIQAYGGFTSEELRRMGAAELIPRPVQAAPASSGGGILTRVATDPPIVPTSYAGDFRDTMRGYSAPVNPNYDYIAGEGTVDDINAAGLARAQAQFSPAAATRAGAANIANGYAAPGHNPALEWHPFDDWQPVKYDPEKYYQD